MPYPDDRGARADISPAGAAMLREIETLADDVLEADTGAEDGLPPPAFAPSLVHMRRARSVYIVANVFFYLAVVFALLLSVSVLLGKTAQGGIGGLRFFIEQTDAMAPAIPRGSLLVTVKRAPGEIEKGDIITFDVLEEQHNSRLTRVVEERIDGTGNGLTFFRTVRPEEGAAPDSILINQTNIQGVKVLALPYAGHLISLLNTYAPAFAVLAASLCCASVLLRRWSRKAKRVRG